MNEIVVDNFAGGGGASVGIEAAIGRPIDIAINHDPEAIAVHAFNHPNTQHYCESVFSVDPVAAANGRPVGLAWFSPDCTHHSKAKGSKPLSTKRRGLAWVAVRWAKRVRPRVIMLENVEEFSEWGPLTPDGKPCPIRKGQEFRRWCNQIQRLGYRLDMRELRACDYGAPTIRKRLFIIARRDGMPIVWPEPTHGPAPVLESHRGAHECIDWSIPVPSIFERSRPLADNTCKRIAAGIMRYVVEAQEPFFISGIDHKGSGTSPVWSATAPLTTVTTENRHALVTAFLAKHYTGVIGSDLRKPLGTVTAIDHHSLVTASMHATGSPTVGQHAERVAAFLTAYYGSERDGQTLFDPMRTIPTKDRFGLVTVRGENYRITDIGLRMLQPPELATAQGFPSWYRFDAPHPVTGKPMGKKIANRMIGNSVSPNLSEALVRANYSISDNRLYA